MSREEQGAAPSRARLLALYGVLFISVAAVILVSAQLGQEKDPPPDVAGRYGVISGGGGDACLGGEFELRQSGRFVRALNTEGTLQGDLELEDGVITGTIECVERGSEPVTLMFEADELTGEIGERGVTAKLRDAVDRGDANARAPTSINGHYVLDTDSPCLGHDFDIEGPDEAPRLVRDEETLGTLSYRDGELSGEVSCIGDAAAIPINGVARDREIEIEVGSETFLAEKEREFGQTVASFLIAVVIVMIAARLAGAVAVRVAQPRVMGEVIAGIVLGPTVFGAVLPNLQAAVFPVDIIPVLGVVANLGLVFYMFLVGLEFDLSQLRGRISQAVAVSNASVALPMALGFAAAVPVYDLVAPPDNEFLPFALFMGVAMSITAFPVLARILVERRMLQRPVGALAMAAAAIDDITAWLLIAFALAVAAGGGIDVVVTIALTAGFCLFMIFGVRPILARVSDAYDEAGRVPGGWIAAIFAGVLLSAYVTESIGVALIIGAFLMGLVMPRHAELTEDVTGRIEDFVVTLLLPLFFAYTGLQINIGLLDRPELWLLTLGLIAVAIFGKLFGAMITARVTGFAWRDSAVVGTLMNTRGLTELIVLNIALEKGIISEALMASLVLMALFTTFMAGPLLKLLDPRNELGSPVEDEFLDARNASSLEFPTMKVPDRSILLAPESDGGLGQLRALAEPLAAGEPPREVIIAKLVRPPQGAAAGVRGGLQTENRLLRDATAEIRDVRDELIESRIPARAVAFISADAGSDITRVTEKEDVDLLLIDGRRPLIGGGVPRGHVGEILDKAPCDVAVLVAREGEPVALGGEGSIIVPFGGTEHDWAALELGAWLASAISMKLSLLGAPGDPGEAPRVTRMLSDAALLVQRYASVDAEPLVSERGSILETSSDAALMIMGLSSRWREEGLGEVRSSIARSASAPVLFVRRGTRPGALAPEQNVTRFSWSSPAMGEPQS